MAQPPNDPWLAAIAIAVVTASAVTWMSLAARWWRGEPLLAFEPRTPVPWGAPVAMLAVAFVTIALLTAGGTADAKPPGPSHTFEVAQRLVGFIFFQCIVIGGILFVVSVVYKPTLRDLGLPVYGEELARDIRIGVVACLAACAPVYGVQSLMLYLLGPSEHPLVKMVSGGEPSIGVALLATVAAVVIAPIGEEILFRLLLQGWLEKIENQWRETLGKAGFRFQFRVVHLLVVTAVLAVALTLLTLDHFAALVVWSLLVLAVGIFVYSLDRESVPTNDGAIELSSILDNATGEDVSPIDDLTDCNANFPRGWPPILISSLLFALAHVGYGPDPIAIFFLAIALGYVYRRTHRLVPCIVAHAMFNSLAMFVLWRFVFLHAE